ncbi:ACP S-malonyltransferase [Streptomyces tateyamensis]|uniref:Malonyl CoA-acyl carrier protein transacylase n=1 Tax=Streptomyces tateyamensis TaxID=565073 RepID=A0A2V4N326_9ACTN|nr:ACP S-malonyltransferase [Streptomyces tateyamensis]PYC72367.1 ACP S-malonyltransferase [Streptomyces tateyamensis]
MSTTRDGSRLALLFPGQGAQRAGLGRPWQQHPAWQLVPELSERTGRDLVQLLTEADDERLRRTDNAQLATFTLEMVILAALRAELGELPVTAVAGHSLGEYSALVAAGVLELGDAAAVVAERGAAMAEAAARTPGTMAVLLGGDAAKAVELAERVRATGGKVWAANLNAPGQVVVSGTEAGVAALVELAPEFGLRVSRIPVGGAFHSPLMQPAQQRLARAWDQVPLSTGRYPVVANVDAAAHSGDPAGWRRLAVRQLTDPVRWEQSMHTLVDGEFGCTELLELGPGMVLTGLARRIAPQVPGTAISTPEQLAVYAERWRAGREALAA